MWGIIANHTDGEIFDEVVPAHSKMFQIVDDDANLYFTGYIDKYEDSVDFDDIQELMESVGATKLLFDGRSVL